MSGSTAVGGAHQHTYADTYLVNGWHSSYDAFGGKDIPTGQTGNYCQAHSSYTTSGTGGHSHSVTIDKKAYATTDDTVTTVADDNVVRPTALIVAFWKRIA